MEIDYNSPVVIATIATAIATVLATSFSNLFLEYFRSRWQRKNAKYGAYHSEQLKVLTKSFKMFSSVSRKAFTVKSLWDHIDVVSSTSQHVDKQQLLEWEKENFVIQASEIIQTIEQEMISLKTYIIDNSLFVDNKLLEESFKAFEYTDKVTAAYSVYKDGALNDENREVLRDSLIKLGDLYTPLIDKIRDKAITLVKA